MQSFSVVHVFVSMSVCARVCVLGVRVSERERESEREEGERMEKNLLSLEGHTHSAGS